MGRIDKVNNAIKKEIGQIIQGELKDPRLGFVTINRVETAKDLSHAKVYFSVLGSDVQVEKVEEGLHSSGGFIRRLLGQRLSMRQVPALSFKLDKSTEYSMHIFQKIEEIKNEPRKNTQSD